MRTQSIDQTIWVVYVDHVSTTEMVTVVIVFQHVMRFLCRPVVRFAHLVEFWTEVFFYFLFRYATDRSVFRHETDIGEIVENGEQRNLGKFGDSCDEYESFIFITSLKHSEYVTVYIGAVFVFCRLP